MSKPPETKDMDTAYEELVSLIAEMLAKAVSLSEESGTDDPALVVMALLRVELDKFQHFILTERLAEGSSNEDT